MDDARFTLDGRALTLHADAFEAMDEGQLFAPFMDATSGAETYGAGRYLDLAPDPDGSYALDFGD